MYMELVTIESSALYVQPCEEEKMSRMALHFNSRSVDTQDN